MSTHAAPLRFAQAITPAETEQTPEQTPESVRAQRESNSSQAITTAATTADGMDEASELEILRETMKRLRDVERDDPARALADYKKFFERRTPHAAVGVEAASKIALLRYATRDVKGALFTCDYMMKKYGDNRNVGLLLLAKADILSREKRDGEAAQVLIENTPRLVAMTPDHYPQVEDVVLRLGQSGMERKDKKGGNEKGRKQAGLLYAGLEQVYLKELDEQVTPWGTWQKVEEVARRYVALGQEPKVNAMYARIEKKLLKLQPVPGNAEVGHFTLEMTRRLSERGETARAQPLYAKIAQYTDNELTGIALLDQGRALLAKGKGDDGRKMLIETLPRSGGELRMALRLVLARSFYSSGDLKNAREYAAAAVAEQGANPNGGLASSAVEARRIVTTVDQWEKTPIICESGDLRVKAQPGATQSLIRRLKVRTFRDVPLAVSVENASFKVRVVAKDEWSTADVASDGFDNEREVIVEIAPEALQKATRATLLVSSPNLGNFQVPVSLRVEAK